MRPVDLNAAEIPSWTDFPDHAAIPPIPLDENLSVLREGCFKYFQLGGEALAGPVSLLSALAPKPLLLAYHFFSVAFYSIWCMFMHPRPVYAGTSPLFN